ncbi:OmpA family protein [Aquimarina sp. W85]|uniref:OmpA family protein n=1 Tax=Aquimarina rhodophyticola TaxID=3342246 RepID=UPI00366FFC90
MKTIISFLLFLLFSYIALSIFFNCDWCNYSKNNQNQGDFILSTPEDIVSKKVIKNSNTLFILNDASDTLYRYEDTLKVLPNSDSIILPQTFNNVVQDLKQYLDTHPTAAIQIASTFLNEDTNKKSELLKKRMLRLKKRLTNDQINGNRIFVDSTSNRSGQALDIRLLEMDATKLKAYDDKISKKLLYSRFNGYRFKPDTALINYTKELKSYLQRHPSKQISVTGHTDSIGSIKNNLWFGKIRAKNVKKYLISQGIDEEKIKIYSKGEQAPIAPNDTEANKAKNRRIEIIIN